MAIHPHSYNWPGVESIDTSDGKNSLMDPNTSIDPTFSQSQHSGAPDDSAFANDHVAQAVAVVKNHQQAQSRQGKSQNPNDPQTAAQQLHSASQMMAQATQHAVSSVGHGAPQNLAGVSSQSMEINRQGRSLTNTKRAQQNRQAQRAFRQRKELYIKDLEAKVNELKQSKDTIDALRQENIQLRDYILALQSRLIEHPGGVPTPPAVYARQTASDMYDHHKGDK